MPITDDDGRVRVKIVRAAGTTFQVPDSDLEFVAADPPQAQEQADNLGWMTEEPCEALGGGKNPKIVLDNGAVLWGYECWWDYVKE